MHSISHDSEDTRESAKRRIHEQELERLQLQIAMDEIDRANAKHTIRLICDRFSHDWVREVVNMLEPGR